MALGEVGACKVFALRLAISTGFLFFLGSYASAADISACLITKTDTNPFFVMMKEGATAKAKELGVTLKAYAGKVDGDHDSQVAAIESCIADGAKGILIAASDTKAIVDSVKKAQDAGLLVIALDTPLDPPEAADATFATDNLLAGKQIGEWAKAKLGDRAKDAKVAFLDLTPSQPTVDVSRDQGFMEGFGIDVKDPTKIGDEDDARIVGHDVTNGNEEGGRMAMENLLQKDPDINVVHAINEPAAIGAYQALKAVGKEGDVLIVSVDGGCEGIKAVQDGVIAATSQQYPSIMAARGIEAIKKYAETGEKPRPTPGKTFFNIGSNLVTQKAQDSVSSIDAKLAANICWGGGSVIFACPENTECKDGSCGCPK